VKSLYLSEMKWESRIILGSQPLSPNLSWFLMTFVAASYSLDILFTSNQYFPGNKTPSTLPSKTAKIGNASIYEIKSPTEEERYLSCLRIL
jgi:hypothetical protein